MSSPSDPNSPPTSQSPGATDTPQLTPEQLQAIQAMEKDPAYQEAKKNAIAFYDQEHDLTVPERKDLYVFYEQLFRRTLLSYSVGFATGVALPFLLRKKGQVISPAYPIAGGFAVSGLFPFIFAPVIYSKGLTQMETKYGEGSRVDRVIKATPSPVIKSWFWSNYFKQSAQNPDMRIKDPRLVLPDPDKNDPNSPDISAWGKVRTDTAAAEKANQPANIYAPTHAGESTDIFNEYGTDKVAGAPASGAPSPATPPPPPTDIYGQPVNPTGGSSEVPGTQGASGSAWDRIRTQNK